MLNPPTSIVETWIREHFEKCKKRGQELNAICSICGDSKKKPGKLKRFFYNLSSGKWFCHNCNARGNDFYSLVSALERIKYGEAVHQFRQHLVQNIKDAWKKPEERVTVIDEGVEFDVVDFLVKKCFRLDEVYPDWPNGMIKRSLAKRAVAEIRAHGVDPAHYPFYVCSTGDYHGRLIIPFYNKGKVVYFQGRSIVKNLYPKYKNCPSPKKDYIFNGHNFHPELPVYVFEGYWESFILDRYCGMNATAVLGKYVHQSFLERLLLKTREIVICMDNDEEGKKALSDLEVTSPRIKCLIYPKGFPYKDIGEMWARFRDPHSIKDLLKSNTQEFWSRKVLL